MKAEEVLELVVDDCDSRRLVFWKEGELVEGVEDDEVGVEGANALNPGVFEAGFQDVERCVPRHHDHASAEFAGNPTEPVLDLRKRHVQGDIGDFAFGGREGGQQGLS